MSQPKITPSRWRCPLCSMTPGVPCNPDGGMHRQRVHYAAYMAYNDPDAPLAHTKAIHFSFASRRRK